MICIQLLKDIVMEVGGYGFGIAWLILHSSPFENESWVDITWIQTNV